MSVRRVLMVNRYFYPYLGGVEFHILNLSLELQRLGVEVEVTTPRRDHDGPDSPFRGLPVRRFARLSGLRAIVAQGWDIVHGHMPRNMVAATALREAQRAGIPFAFTPHAFYPSHDLPCRLAKAVTDATVTRWMLKRAAVTINLTQVDQADALARGLPRERSHLVPNSVRASELAASPEQPFASARGITRPFLLHVGRFDRVKHIDFLVRAQRHVPDLDLVLIGPEGPTFSHVRALLDDDRVRGRVHVVPRASFPELCNAYRECRALVLASAFEGLPTVVLEALFFGRPVVASAVGGVPSVMTRDVLGAIYPCLDEAAYLTAVRRVVATDTPADRAARRAHVEAAYTWEVNAARVLAAYEAARAA